MSKAEALIKEGAVLLDLVDGVAHVQLNRPDAANGLDIPTLKDLHTALMMCHGERQVKVVLLTGRGLNFCAGGDVRTFSGKGDALPEYIRQATVYLQAAISAMIHLDAPVIAAVQGFAAGGGGMGLICAADIVLAGESAKFLAGATRVAMAPDAGLSVTLPRLVGPRKAAEMLLMNPTVSAAEALELGLINQVVPDAELQSAALAYAQHMAQGAPRALAATKRLLWAGIGIGVDAAMPEESRTVAALCRTADVQEGLAAVIEKRVAHFTGS
ncbi:MULTISPECIES: enoyl-CoA hydratase/isomerase family protein [unclassified Pseudomonas]|uniref:enoyl-CoA hydratase/isomerase family protein n=1 Tax=unclassified Pseudomonas TaxID=196821 RepID=UPI000C888521|nr:MULTISPECIES: enoyl-CoA hydratase-related protein [unclassified Pseudomonas]PMX27456.1 enoyl-CoA hydratase [Pseudomonas sp. GW460-12]PMX34476.1 enoyl-CoA hydratase [Pseudomonas sp. MPR-R2A4]PMX41883.1 enoyl-CoA hydratase [Pseudomonas sp. MPR-R2A7]PMX53839.1 enoyl-CoA hydratase [Pseudomonas sp. MPR-R2A6]PMX91320.1 enoyl-CoA hydratase [Pseudomonas sp. MPR-R2A3]